MTVGDVLDRGVRLFVGRLPLLFGINFIVMIPIFVLALVQPFLLKAMIESAQRGGSQAGAFGAFAGGTALALLLYVLILPIAVAATLTVTIREYLGQTVTVGEALGTAFRRFPGLLGTAFLVWILSVLGFMACCIPGIYMGVIYMFASQIVIAESTSGMPALNRSSSLVSGHWWRLFAVVFLVGIISAAVQWMVLIPLGFVLPAQETVMTQMGPTFIFNTRNQIIHALVQIPFQVVFQAFQAICITLLYLDMRIRKEGLDLQIAAQQLEQGEGQPQ